MRWFDDMSSYDNQNKVDYTMEAGIKSWQDMLDELRIHQYELETQNNELVESKNKLELSENRYKRIFQNAPVAFLTLNRDGLILTKNQRALEMFQTRIEEPKPFVVYVDPESHLAFYDHLEQLFDKQKTCQTVIKLRDRGGRGHFCQFTSIPLPGEEDLCLTAVVDIDEIKRKEELISKMAYYDTLTGLPNRTFLVERLGYGIKNAKRNKEKLAVLFVDLDNFKQINDTYGHNIGDQVLKEIGSRMSAGLREADTCARMGGDEFVVLLNNVSKISEPAEVAERMLTIINQPVSLSYLTFKISASLGIAVFPNDGRSADALIRSADTAMYRSKAQGKNTYSYFNSTMRDEVARRNEKERLLREAIGRGELRLVYQPQLGAATGEIRGVEALLRWESQELGSISPCDFIPLAEETALIGAIGEWVVTAACEEINSWRARGVSGLKLAINLSAKQIKEPGFVDKVRRILATTELRPQDIEFEITESVYVAGSSTALETLAELKQLGVSISLDDFGTGYASFNYLAALPIEVVKIDKSFVGEINVDRNKFYLVQSIVFLAHKLGKKVVAEGVETPEQLAVLRELECDYIQGYYFYKPMTPEALLSILEK